MPSVPSNRNLPSHRAWKRLTHADRALCRFLIAKGVPHALIHEKIGWSMSTIYNIKKDRYVTKDVKADDDQYFGTDFDRILRKVRQHEDTTSEVSEEERVIAPRRSKRVMVRARAPSPPSPPFLRRSTRASAVDPFVMMILSSVSMDKGWAAAFWKAKVTEGTLRRFAKLPSIHFHDFLEERFPLMTCGERFDLDDALHDCIGDV
ncbi:hypothetical protein B0H11DRAFT_2113550 [Mycena galericulata]|nr:hypothetical protein B0H11DRAFT_2113550 [Mycena galericulata]